MFGGGKGAFIGAIHRCAAFMDNRIELVCGCFSSKPEKSLESGRELLLDDSRIYICKEDQNGQNRQDHNVDSLLKEYAENIWNLKPLHE